MKRARPQYMKPSPIKENIFLVRVKQAQNGPKCDIYTNMANEYQLSTQKIVILCVLSLPSVQCAGLYCRFFEGTHNIAIFWVFLVLFIKCWCFCHICVDITPWTIKLDHFAPILALNKNWLYACADAFTWSVQLRLCIYEITLLYGYV